MKLGLTGRAVATCAAALALVAVTLGSLVYAVDGFRAESALSTRSEQVLATANQLGATLFYVSQGERGYLATGDLKFLHDYRMGLQSYDALAARLTRLVASRPDQARRVRGLLIAINAFQYGWADALAERAGGDLGPARQQMDSGKGEERLTAIIGRFDVFGAKEQQYAARHRAASSALAHRAVLISIAAFFGIVLLALLLVVLLNRTAVGPVRRLVGAMRCVGGGDLAVRADGQAVAEIGQLERGFNAMAESLEHHRDELESQHAELEAQQDEVERALVELAEQKETVEGLFEYAEQLAGQTEVAAAAALVLERMAEAAGADVGTLYLADDDGSLAPAASRGLDPATLLPEPSPLDGAAGVGDGGLHLPALGKDVVLHHELHVPLLQGHRALGVLMLGRLRPEPFTDDEQARLAHMADQSSVALGNVLSLANALRLGALNKALIDSVFDGIRLVDMDGNIMIENRRVVELLTVAAGAPPTGSFWDQAEAIAARTTDPEAARLALEDLRGDDSITNVFEYELADSGRILSRYAAPVWDTNGAQIGRLIVLREVTGERQLQRMKDEFVATVTHELRTPLTSIAGYVELLLDEQTGELTDDQRRFLGVVGRNTDRLVRLVGDLLFDSRLEAGMLELQPGPADVDSLVAEAVESARPAAEAHRLTLDASLGGLPELFADGPRIAQMIDNLLSNAVKFTPPGGSVHVSTALEGQRAFLSVADTGLGIPAAEKAQLFQRFFRASAATRGAIAGTGLGLAITKAIAEAHGGSITVLDTPGGGTTFRVELPLVATAAVKDAA
jgi:signal transduction histidine kinase/CHASE3 domain sensor protein